jgi:predicted kinase
MQNKTAIFTLGLPGSGKSEWIKHNIKQYDVDTLGFSYMKDDEYLVVSADEIRLNHPSYDPLYPDKIQDECVTIAKNKVLSYAIDGYNIVMDGGGINRQYTANIISTLKNTFNYTIKIVFINTPVNVCVYRNNLRIKNNERFVPKSAIIDKAYKLKHSVALLYQLADQFIQIDYYTNKHLFIDLDGTLAEYQDLPVDEFGDVNFVEYGVFENASPVKEMIAKISALAQSKEIYIVSASPNSICNAEKLNWCAIHVPFIKKENIYFVGNKQFKYVFLRELINKLKLNQWDCMVVDDDHLVISQYKTLGINVVHPSKLLASY